MVLVAWAPENRVLGTDLGKDPLFIADVIHPPRPGRIQIRSALHRYEAEKATKRSRELEPAA